MTSPVTSIALADATPEQKRAFATNFLSLDLEPDTDDATIDSLIARAQPGIGHIFVMTGPDAAPEIAAEAAAEPEPQGVGSVGTLGRGDPRAIIQIPVVDTEDKSGENDVMVGVNGRAWQLQRGVDLPVPWRVVIALQNAIGESIRHDPSSGDETKTINKRVSFQFVEKPSDAEIKRWHEETDALFCA